MTDNLLPKMGTAAWDTRADSEVDFWRNWVSSKGGKWPEDFQRRTDPETPLIEAIADQLEEMNLSQPHTAEVLDIGSGPLSLLGYSSPNQAINLTLVDPLAEAYNVILDNAGITGVPRPQKGYFETALGQLGENRFDVVWCRNALDHSIDPLLGLHSLIAMCRPGGRVILSFHPNEADTGNYGGLHQWNLNNQDGKICLSQKGLELDLTPLLSQQEVLSVSQYDQAGKDKGDVTIKLKKTCDPNLSQAMMLASASSSKNQLKSEG